MSWFESLFGVRETSYAATRAAFRLEPDPGAGAPDAVLLVAPNGRRFPAGAFSTPSLASLRAAAPAPPPPAAARLTHAHAAVGDVLRLHARAPGATFQAASQFNTLEFPSPDTVPEDGITAYSGDRTQGPACALAAPAGAFVRNYAARVSPRAAAGQTRGAQINTLRPLLDALPGGAGRGVQVRNGYTSAVDADALRAVGAAVAGAPDRDALMGLLEVGVQRRVGVVYARRWVEVDSGEDVRVTQVLCSALSVAYDPCVEADELWAPLARLVLDGCYEATLLVAEAERRAGAGSGEVYLTFVGGGVFGNADEWIAGAIARALWRCRSLELRVHICHFRGVDAARERLVEDALAGLAAAAAAGM